MDPRIDKLNQLAKELYAIAETLNDSGEACTCCGSYRRNDFAEYSLRQKVEGAVVTVSNLAGAFEQLPQRKLGRYQTNGRRT